MWKRYIVEFGTGADLHGMDMTKAACKAVKDAISHSCLSGITEIIGITDPATQMKVAIKIAAPMPEKVDLEKVKAALPFGKAEIEVVSGGLNVTGLSVQALGEGDQIVLVNAALTVYIEVEA